MSTWTAVSAPAGALPAYTTNRPAWTTVPMTRPLLFSGHRANPPGRESAWASRITTVATSAIARPPRIQGRMPHVVSGAVCGIPMIQPEPRMPPVARANCCHGPSAIEEF